MKILYEMEDSISFDMTNILDQKQIVKADVTEATLIVKNKNTDADEDSLVSLTIGDGLEWDVSETKILATFRNNDWGVGKMVVGGRYVWGFGFKTNTNNKYIEVNLGDEHICITQDIIRN